MIEKVLSAAVLAIVVLTPTYASSITLPSAAGYEIAGGNDVSGNAAALQPGSLTAIATFTDGLDSALAVGNAGGPSATASANGDLIASASLEYYFEISGPATLDVPVTLSGIVGAGLGPSFSGAAEAYAEVRIFDRSANAFVLDLWDCVGSGCSRGGNVIAIAGSYTQSVMLASNNLFELELGAVASPNSFDPSTSAIAAADPYIFIDPSFATANPGYSIVVSPGVNNSPTSTVPEPDTIGLAAIALAIQVFLGVRSRKRT